MTDDMPIPGLAPAFELEPEFAAPVEIGALATGGRRTQRAVTGGRATGELAGELVGGSETVFERADGVAVVEAVYCVRRGAGAAVRLFGQGYRTAAHTRLTLLAEAAADGPLAPLAALVFIAEAQPGETRLAVMRVT